MFRVQVVARGQLARNSRMGREAVHLRMSDGGRVRDLLSMVGVHETEVRRVVVNGRRGRLDQVLRREDMVELYG